MKLVRIDGAQENEWLRSQAGANGLQGDPWMGANDRATEGDWRWPDGALFWQEGTVGGAYENWAWGNPDGRGWHLTDASCGSWAAGGSTEWWDEDCSDLRTYICEGGH